MRHPPFGPRPAGRDLQHRAPPSGTPQTVPLQKLQVPLRGGDSSWGPERRDSSRSNGPDERAVRRGTVHPLPFSCPTPGVALCRSFSATLAVFLLIDPFLLMLRFGCLLALLAFSSTTLAQDAEVPVERVVLFSSGVGFFQHGGSVAGDADAVLRFTEEQLNDVLKSLVVEDLSGGRVEAVVYPSQAPVERTLRAFAIDLTRGSSLPDVLRQLAGAEVEVVTPGGAVRGVVIGVEGQPRMMGDGAATVPVLSLATEAGLRTVRLDTAEAVRIVDPALRAELDGALRAIAEARAGSGGKPVRLVFSGSGQRHVRFAYVVEAPVWKTSYRLVLPEEAEGRAELQGWAIVENQTDSDWDGITLSLVSGRPISFVQDLYSPLYVERPRVGVQAGTPSAQPRVYEEGVAAGTITGRVVDEDGDALPGASVRVEGTQMGAATNTQGQFRIGGVPVGSYTLVASFVGYEPQTARVRLAGRGARVDFRLSSGARELSEVAVMGLSTRRAPDLDLNTRGGQDEDVDYYVDGLRVAPDVDVTRSVQAAAEGGDVGELFEYTIPAVSLPRQRSAMLPIVTAGVRVERVSLYGPGAPERHPMRGFRLTNTTDLHLAAGPATLFEDGTYAGDAQLPDLPPRRERFAAYAVDLDVVVTQDLVASGEGEVISGKIVDGVLELERRFVTERSYTVENKGDRRKTVVIEHPQRGNAEIVRPEPFELTGGLARFRVEVRPGDAETLVVREEQLQTQVVVLGDMVRRDPDRLAAFVRGGRLPAEVRAALDEAVARQRALARAERELEQTERRLNGLDEEQARIRQNLRTVPEDRGFYREQLQKLEAVEREIERLREEAAERRQRFEELQEALAEYLEGLNVG